MGREPISIAALRRMLAAGTPSGDVTAWLIERNNNGFPEWVSRLDAYSDDCVVSWTRDANLAIRFMRHLDCDRVLPALGGRFGRVFPTEHLWIGEDVAATTAYNALPVLLDCADQLRVAQEAFARIEHEGLRDDRDDTYLLARVTTIAGEMKDALRQALASVTP